MKKQEKLSHVIDRLYFKKYDDQMYGLTKNEEKFLKKIGRFLDSI